MRKGDTVIERKEINDFFNSMGAHMQNQYCDMMSYPYRVLIISGHITELSYRHKNKITQFYGAVARLIKQGVTVLWVQNDAMLVTMALSIMEKSEKLPGETRIVKRMKNSTNGIIHASSPRIPVKVRDALLEKFKTPLGIAQASEKELVEVKGCGLKLAKNIYSNFRKDKDGVIHTE